MMRISVATVLTPMLAGVLVAMCSCDVGRYDKARYEMIESTIAQSTNMLAGLSLTEVSKLLSLGDVRWDEGYCNAPLCQERIYHFQGFCMHLQLEVRPQGITPDSAEGFSYVESELRSNGVWWVSHRWPQLKIDRLDDPRTRMSNYWDNVHAGFRRHGLELKITQQRMRAETNK